MIACDTSSATGISMYIHSACSVGVSVHVPHANIIGLLEQIFIPAI